MPGTVNTFSEFILNSQSVVLSFQGSLLRVPGVTVMWASPCQITLAIWVRVTGDAHITVTLGDE